MVDRRHMDLAWSLIFPLPLQESFSLHRDQPHLLPLSGCAAASSIRNLSKSKTGKFSFTINTILSSLQSYSPCNSEAPQLPEKKQIELGLF